MNDSSKNVVSRNAEKEKNINGSAGVSTKDSSSTQQSTPKTPKDRVVSALKSARSSVAPAAQNLASSLKNVKRSVQMNASSNQKTSADVEAGKNGKKLMPILFAGKDMLKSASGMLNLKAWKSKSDDVKLSNVGKFGLDKGDGEESSHKLKVNNVFMATVLSASQIPMESNIVNGKEEYLPSGHLQSTHIIVDDEDKEKESKKRSHYESSDGEWRVVVSINHNKQSKLSDISTYDIQKPSFLMKHEEISSEPIILLSPSKDPDSLIESTVASAAMWLDPDDKVDIERSKDISDESIKNNKIFLLGVPRSEGVVVDKQFSTMPSGLRSNGSKESSCSSPSSESLDLESEMIDDAQDSQDEIYTITVSLKRDCKTSIEKNMLPKSKEISLKKIRRKKAQAAEESFELEDVYSNVMCDAIQTDVIDIGSTSFFVSYRYTDLKNNNATTENSNAVRSSNNRPVFESVITSFSQNDGSTIDEATTKQWFMGHQDSRVLRSNLDSSTFSSKLLLTLPLFESETPTEQLNDNLRKSATNSQMASHDGKINFDFSQQTNKHPKPNIPAGTHNPPCIAIRLSLLEMELSSTAIKFLSVNENDDKYKSLVLAHDKSPLDNRNNANLNSDIQDAVKSCSSTDGTSLKESSTMESSFSLWGASFLEN